MRFTCTTIISTLALAIALSIPAGAQAKSSLRYVTEVANAPAEGDFLVNASCPADSRLTAGGGRLERKAPTSGLAALAPFDGADLGGIDDDGFRAAGYNGALDDYAAEATAICLRENSDALSYEEEDGTTSAAASTFGGGVGCSPARALGGGIQIEGPYAGDIALRRASPSDYDDPDSLPDDGFGFGSRKLATADARNYNRDAICIEAGIVRLRYVTAHSTLTKEFGTLKADCPNGSRVAGGGGGSEIGTLLASTPYDGEDRDLKPDDGWSVRVRSPYGGPLELTATAICLK